MFNLTSTGNKIFIFLSWSIQTHSVGKNLVPLTTYELKIFLKDNPKYQINIPTIRRGLDKMGKRKKELNDYMNVSVPTVSKWGNRR